MRLSFLALMGGLGVVAACGDDTDRPCSAGSPGCVGDGDADSDSDTDADTDGDGDADLCGDTDLDGYTDAACPDGTGDDCDDTHADVHPGATEVCNGMDDDCTGGADEGMLSDGTDVVVDSGGVAHLIAFAAGGQGYGLVALTGDDMFCDGANNTPGRALTFTELRADGTAVGTPVPISSTPECYYYHTLAVAPVAAGWVVAWADAPAPVGASPGRDGFIQVALVSGSAVTVGPLDLGDRESRLELAPILAVGPPGILVVWDRADTEMVYALLDPDDLAVLATGSLGQGAVTGGRPSAAWTGAAFLVGSESGADSASVFVVNQDGTEGPRNEFGLSYWDSPVVGWDGFEAVFTLFQNNEQDLFVLNELGEGDVTDPIVIPVKGKAMRMAGLERSFGVLALVDENPLTLTGVPTFWNISGSGLVSNEIEPDDTGSTQAGAPWVAPAGNGWALAWIDDERQVRVDFVGCVAD